MTTTPTFAAPPRPVTSVDPPLSRQSRDTLIERYRAVRATTERLTEPLETEDFVLQTMPDVSPAKWHLGHTSWFFEQFLLGDNSLDGREHRPFHPKFAYLFNSYYVSVGDRHCRIKRGSLGRPTVKEIFEYRGYVDEHLVRLLETADEAQLARLSPLMEIGLNHEQQHQELLVTDIKHVFSCNPVYPVYREQPAPAKAALPEMRFLGFNGGLREVGHAGDVFAFDNEGPRHKVYVNAFELADRLVTNGEYLQFIEDGGYQNVPLWLSAGAAAVAQDPLSWGQPFYWQREGNQWYQFTLGGLRELDPDEPVCHLSYYEADAFARWKGCRLPTEFEWEVACIESGVEPAGGNFLEDGAFHPRPLENDNGRRSLQQMYGDVWEWTASQYTPYPGYKPAAGALGEYNGKFMCNQFVLRGGSCATPRSHIRPTYRNFFPPEARWQFTGLRLARDADA